MEFFWVDCLRIRLKGLFVAVDGIFRSAGFIDCLVPNLVPEGGLVSVTICVIVSGSELSLEELSGRLSVSLSW